MTTTTATRWDCVDCGAPCAPRSVVYCQPCKDRIRDDELAAADARRGA